MSRHYNTCTAKEKYDIENSKIDIEKKYRESKEANLLIKKEVEEEKQEKHKIQLELDNFKNQVKELTKRLLDLYDSRDISFEDFIERLKKIFKEFATPITDEIILKLENDINNMKEKFQMKVRKFRV